jgi:hypothetical protein
MRTDDVFATVRAMRDARGGFSLMDRPREEYYAALRDRLGHDTFTEAQVAECRVSQLGFFFYLGAGPGRDDVSADPLRSARHLAPVGKGWKHRGPKGGAQAAIIIARLRSNKAE